VAAPRVFVDDYDPDWPRRAETLIASVLAASNGVVHHVDHIGSTSIPGMAAKNVIDLQASVDDLDGIPLEAAAISRVTRVMLVVQYPHEALNDQRMGESGAHDAVPPGERCLTGYYCVSGGSLPMRP
jgi:GrpB-like predicted nucleotidyltransferase (UPF0157 family)